MEVILVLGERSWVRPRQSLSSPVSRVFHLPILNTGWGVAPSTVEAYRSAIRGVLLHTQGADIGHDSVLSQLIRAMFQLKPLTRVIMPQWDLALVLASLRRPPFEPLEAISLKFLSYKTVFLLAIASGCRCSELHALSRTTLVWSVQGS